MSFKPELTTKKQNGFTLIETLIALAITGLISGPIAMSTFQVVGVNTLTSNHMMAVKQVENAIHWISRDAQMAQNVQTSVGSGFPLIFNWVDWDNVSYDITYSVQNGNIQRSRSVDGGQPTVTIVAQHIDSGATTCQFTSDVLTLKVTASLSGFRPASESRVVQVVPKPR